MTIYFSKVTKVNKSTRNPLMADSRTESTIMVADLRTADTKVSKPITTTNTTWPMTTPTSSTTPVSEEENPTLVSTECNV